MNKLEITALAVSVLCSVGIVIVAVKNSSPILWACAVASLLSSISQIVIQIKKRSGGSEK